MARNSTIVSFDTDKELASLGYPRRNTGTMSPRHNNTITSEPMSTSVTFPPMPSQNIFQRLYRNYLKPAQRTSQTQPQLPLYKSIEAEKGIMEYAKSEWNTEKHNALRMKRGYAEVEKQFERIRRVRGDNLCAVRSILFQILTMSDLRLSILAVFPTKEVAIERLKNLRFRFKDLVKDWSFGQNAKLKEGRDEFNTLKECIATFYQLAEELNNLTTAKRRAKVETELNSWNGGQFEKDARLVEFVKFLMFSKAAELYDTQGKGEEVPTWFLFLTLRDHSDTLQEFFHFHLNRVGDSLGLEQIEMFLLGVSLNVRIRAFRLKSIDEEDFETYYPPIDDPSLQPEVPCLPLIAEDDRHYNVVYSTK